MFFFFFNDTATTEIYTLSLHDTLPICRHDRTGRDLRARAGRDDVPHAGRGRGAGQQHALWARRERVDGEHRSEEHTSELSHLVISYAVFCLKKKKRVRNSQFMLNTPEH